MKKKYIKPAALSIAILHWEPMMWASHDDIWAGSKGLDFEEDTDEETDVYYKQFDISEEDF